MITLADDEILFRTVNGAYVVSLSTQDVRFFAQAATSDIDLFRDEDFALRSSGLIQGSINVFDPVSGAYQGLSESSLAGAVIGMVSIGENGFGEVQGGTPNLSVALDLNGDDAAEFSYDTPTQPHNTSYSEGGLLLLTIDGDIDRIDLSSGRVTENFIDGKTEDFNVTDISVMPDGRVIGFIEGSTGIGVGEIDRQTGEHTLLFDLTDKIPPVTTGTPNAVLGSSTYAEMIPSTFFDSIEFVFTSGDDSFVGTSTRTEISLPGNFDAYRFTRVDSDTLQVAAAGQGVDTLSGFSRINFADRSIDTDLVQVLANDLALNQTTSVFRYFDQMKGGHFLTVDSEEASTYATVRPSAVRDTTPFEALRAGEEATGAVDVYRFFNTQTGAHFYTSSEAERESLEANSSDIYQLEGVAFRAWNQQIDSGVPVERYFDQAAGRHLYAVNVRSQLEDVATISYEGIAFWAMPEGFV